MIYLFYISNVLLALAAPTTRGHRVRETDFKVKEMKNRLEVATPNGLKLYQGNFALDHLKNYKVRIPLSDLVVLNDATDPKPAEPPKNEEEAPVNEKKVSVDAEKVKTIEEVKKETVVEEKRTVAAESPAPIVPDKGMLPPPNYESSIDDSGSLLVKANQLYNQKKYTKALILVEEVIRKKPQLIRPRIMYGSLLYVLGQKELAKDAWNEAKKLDPNNPWIDDILKRYP